MTGERGQFAHIEPSAEDGLQNKQPIFEGQMEITTPVHFSPAERFMILRDARKASARRIG